MFKHNRRMTGLVGFIAVAASAGALFIGASAANAAAPPFEPDPNAVGTLTFYNDSGAVITSGRSDVAPFAAYVAGSNAIKTGDNQAAVYFAAPDPNKTTTLYPRVLVGNFNTYPLTSGPQNLQNLPATTPVNVGTSSDYVLDDFRASLSNPSTTAGYAGVVQVRLRTADPSGQSGTAYETADIVVDSAAHTWTQVYPTPKPATTTTLAASPSPATVGDSITLTATEKPTVAGSVQFQDGTTNIGSPVAVNGSGVATTTTTTLAQGSHTLNAVFTPTDTTTSNGSTGTTTLTVNPAATPTNTALAVTQDGIAGDAATLTATVTGPGATANSSGSVSFFDNGSSTALGTVAGTSAVNGVYTLSRPAGFTAGPHSIVAKFAPTDVTQFAVSQSTAQSFVTQAPKTGVCAVTGSVCTDTQNVQVTVPTGTLVINTPYTPSAPLDLGTMALNSTGTGFTASGTFKNIVVTDTRPGTNGYTVSALSSPLTDGGTGTGSTINAQNVGLTGVSTVGSAGFAGTTTITANPAADPAVAATAAGSAGLGGSTAHTVFSATTGRGTVTAKGTLTINAPTSTESGLFTGTITFTVG